MITIRNMSKSIDDFQMSRLDVNVRAGRIVGLVGENGSGKTTLLRLILGVDYPDSGVIKVFDKDVLTQSERADIGYVPDVFPFSQDIRLSHYAQSMRYVFASWNENAFINFMRDFNIDTSASIKKLSKGAKQIIMLATALSHSSSLLILDEFTAGLDPNSRDAMLELIQKYVLNEGKSVVWASHAISDMEKIIDDIVLIDHGQLIWAGSVLDLKQRYRIWYGEKSALPQGVVATTSHAFQTQALVDTTQSLCETEEGSLETILILMKKGMNHDSISMD